ncbi:MAG: ester cyclase [Candidatus Promineifilaceae bacterium]
MPIEEHKALVQRFVAGFNQGDLAIIDETISPSFFNYKPAPGEETAPEVLHQLAGDLVAAFPDMKIAVDNFNDGGETLSFTLTLSGTQKNELWGAPGSGKHATWTSSVTSRIRNGKFAFSWVDLSLPDVMATLRSIDMVPPPEDMNRPMKYPVSIPEFLLKLIYTGQVAALSCGHLDLIKVTEPTTEVCNECAAAGDVWPALRMCLICGYVGCCDTSKNKHMKQHYEQTGHPLFRSIRLQESWIWCYEDDVFLSGKILKQFI